MIKNNNYSLKISNFLIILLPLSLISGPFLSDLSVVLVDIFFLYCIFSEKNWKFFNKPIFIYLFLFCIFIIIRSLSITSDNFLFSLKSSGPYFRFVVFAIAVSFFLEKSDKLLIKFSYSLLFAFIILLLDGYFQYITGHNILGKALNNSDKLNIFLRDEGVLGSYLARLLPLLAGIIIFNIDYLKYKHLTAFFFSLLIILIMLSGSRSSTFISGLFLVLLFIQIKELRVTFLIFSILVIGTLFFATGKSEKLKNSILFSIKDPINTILTPVNKTETSNQLYQKFSIFTPVYNSHYITAYKMFSENKIFGQGPNTYRKLCGDVRFNFNKFSCTTHPHNFYLQLLAETGIIGFSMIFILFLGVVIKIIKNFFLIKKTTKKDKCLLLKQFILFGLFLNLWPIIPSGNFFGNWLNILIYLPVGFYLYLDNKKN